MNSIPKPNDINFTGKRGFTFFDTLGKKAIWVCLAVISVMVYIVYKDYILFEKAFIFSADPGNDTVTFFYPYLYLQVDYFQKHGYLGWSFQYGMGENNMLFACSEIFNLIFYLFRPDKIHYLFIVREVLKIILIGFFSYKYFKLIGISNTVAVYGSIIFSFCSYVILGGTLYTFSYDAFCFVFILFALEKSLMLSKFFYLPIAVFLIAVAQPANLFVFGLFLATYILFRFFYIDERVSFKTIFYFFLKILPYALIGLLLSAPFLLENIIQMIESPRGSTNLSPAETLKNISVFALNDPFKLAVSFFRLLSSDTLGHAINFAGRTNYLDAPILYCGLSSLVMATQIFGFLKTRTKIVFIVFFMLWLLPVVFPYFRYCLWLFVGDYFRTYGFIVSLVLILFSVLSLDLILKHNKVNLITLYVTLSFIFLCIIISTNFFHTQPEKNNLNSNLLLIVKLLLLFYALLLAAFHFLKGKRWIIYIFFITVITELVYMADSNVNNRGYVSMSSFNSRVGFNKRPGFNDYTIDIAKYLNKKENSFYRIDKDYGTTYDVAGSTNDAMTQGFYSTSVYTSFNQVNYINYLIDNNVIQNEEWQTRWVKGLSYRRVLESLNSVKYFLTKDYGWPKNKLKYLDSLGKIGDVYVFKCKNALPLGYAYKNVLKRSDFLKANSFQKDYLLLNSCYVDDKDFNLAAGLKKYELKDSISVASFNDEIFKNRVDNLRSDSLNIASFSETKINGTVNSSANEILYLSIPLDKGWHLKVDNKEQEFIKVNGGMSGVLLNKGPHSIELEYKLRYFYKGLILAVVGILCFVFLLYYNIRNLKTFHFFKP